MNSKPKLQPTELRCQNVKCILQTCRSAAGVNITCFGREWDQTHPPGKNSDE